MKNETTKGPVYVPIEISAELWVVLDSEAKKKGVSIEELLRLVVKKLLK